YVPESIERWRADEIERLPRRTLTEIGLRALRPFTRGDIDPATLEAVVVEALNFEIPLVEVEPNVFALELFHGPTFAFKDVGARIMARLMASLHRGEEPLTILAATSGDTGSAVAHAFYRVPSTRVVILYPDGRVSPTQEAQLTMFNGDRANVRAYAVAGSFDDCHRLTREAFGDAGLRRPLRAARVDRDDRQRDGRRPSEQLRAHALAVRRRPRCDAARHRGLPLHRRRGARGDPPRIRSARLPARSAQRHCVLGSGRSGG